MATVVLIVVCMMGTCLAGCQPESIAPCPKAKADTAQVDVILKELNQKTKDLKTYQCEIEYLISQPLFESQTLRTGSLYYQRTGKESKLRVNFETYRADDEKPQKHIEHYIIDGVWLTHIDYQMKEVKMHQLADPNEPNTPTDAFELVSRNFPIVGFADVNGLKQQFEVKLVDQEESQRQRLIQLHLKVKPDSMYKDDYRTIDFWLDKKLGLPVKIVAISAEEDEDIYQIRLLNAKVNKNIDKKVFDVKIPKGFGEPKVILKKNEKH